MYFYMLDIMITKHSMENYSVNSNIKRWISPERRQIILILNFNFSTFGKQQVFEKIFCLFAVTSHKTRTFPQYKHFVDND